MLPSAETVNKEQAIVDGLSASTIAGVVGLVVALVVGVGLFLWKRHKNRV